MDDASRSSRGSRRSHRHKHKSHRRSSKQHDGSLQDGGARAKMMDDSEMESVAVESWQQFLVEYKKMARALHRSQQVQKELVDQISTMKTEMVNNALRLQVALRMKNDDDKTIYVLRKEAGKAWEAANLSKHKEASAQKLILELRMEVKYLREEVDSLRADLFLLERALPAGGPAGRPGTGQSGGGGGGGGGGRAATPGGGGGGGGGGRARGGGGGGGDRRALRGGGGGLPRAVTPLVGGSKSKVTFEDERAAAAAATVAGLSVPLVAQERPSPFHEWKVANNIWTPDTPAGSAGHDPHALAAARLGAPPTAHPRALAGRAAAAADAYADGDPPLRALQSSSSARLLNIKRGNGSGGGLIGSRSAASTPVALRRTAAF